MKVIAAYIASFVCCWIGHYLSIACMRWEWTTPVTYRGYQWFMDQSIDAELWAGIEFMWKEEIRAGGTD